MIDRLLFLQSFLILWFPVSFHGSFMVLHLPLLIFFPIQLSPMAVLSFGVRLEGFPKCEPLPIPPNTYNEKVLLRLYDTLGRMLELQVSCFFGYQLFCFLLRAQRIRVVGSSPVLLAYSLFL